MKNFLIAVIFLFVFIALQKPVTAHTLKIDGNIGVTLHVEPSDEPVVGKTSNIFIDIQDNSRKFDPNNPENCDCYLEILKGETPLKRISLVAGNSFTQPSYTFPEKGTYTLIVSGVWNGEDVAFDDFRVSYDYYVSEKSSSSPHQILEQNSLKKYVPFVILIAIGSIILLFLLPATVTKNE